MSLASHRIACGEPGLASPHSLCRCASLATRSIHKDLAKLTKTHAYMVM